jgi:hypothetical protein
VHAQVVQGGTTPEQRDEMNRIVHEMLIPALQGEKASWAPLTWRTGRAVTA